MTGGDFRSIRALYGETQTEFARRLGYVGSSESLKRKINRYESGATPIVGPLAALLEVLRELRHKADTRRRRKGTSPL